MKHIVVTGAAGFIGSNLSRRLNKERYSRLVLVDSFDNPAKSKNLEDVQYSHQIERSEFIDWLKQNASEVGFIFHIGARSDTAEFDLNILDKLNLGYTKSLWEICTANQIPFLYASSAATYGLGENGFSDEHSLIKDLKPLNPYGVSKHRFDLFAPEQKQTPPFWCGLKFFNVYGPYEAHKGRMASMAFHAYNQIKQMGKVKLFKSHHPAYKDGEQLRDFIYVDDVVDVCMFFFESSTLHHRFASGIYNVGTGTARTFNDLAKAIFSELNLPYDIEYIPTPEDIRAKYQYFTEAKIDKLRAAGYNKHFTGLEEGIAKYVAFLDAE
jgi:ADP-L-glycero-D-manno-heptose 6-epimerase